MIQLQTLGGSDLTDPDRRAELQAVLAQPKRFGLLVYLSLAGSHRFRRRDTLVGLFWPELDADHARGALRQALRFLRRQLGFGVLIGRGEEEVGVNQEALCCDATELALACQISDWKRALELYRGDLLAGVYLPETSAEFERWLDHERERLRRLAAAAAWSLVSVAEEAGDLLHAAPLARRAVELSPNDEAGVRRFMRILDRKGERAGALQAYEAFRLHLAADYEAVPAPETRALLQSIRSREIKIWESPLSGWPPPGASR
jgi:DNA-binding SARP family transcriptional activator